MTDQLTDADRDLYELDCIDDAIPAEIRDYSKVQALLNEHAALDLEIAQLSATLKDKQERMKGLLELSLPDAVRDFDVKAKSMTMEDGTAIALEDQCHVSIAVADRSRAHAWLEENGHGALLKWTYTIEFGKNEGVQARAFQRMVSNLFPEREISIVLGRTPTELGKALTQVMESAFPKHVLECETTVHSGSLKALIKKIRNKVTLPPEIKVFAPTVATITRPERANLDDDIFDAPTEAEKLRTQIVKELCEATGKSADQIPALTQQAADFVSSLAAPLAPSEETPHIVLTPKQLADACRTKDPATPF